MIRLFSLAAMLALILGGCSQEALGLRGGSDPREQPGPSLRSRWPFPRETASYQVKIISTNELLWNVTWIIRVQEQGGRLEVEIDEQGQGQPLHQERPIVWQKRMVFEPAPEFQVRSVRGSRWTLTGEPVSAVDLEVDLKHRRIRYQDVDPEGVQGKATLPTFSKLVPVALLFHWVRTLDFEGKPAGECMLLVSPRRRFRMRAFVRGTEEVATPAGTFHCYRLEFLPYLGPLDLLPLKWFIPKMTLWCSSSPPHFWVKYEGPVGGPGSPVATAELTSFQQEISAGKRGRVDLAPFLEGGAE